MTHTLLIITSSNSWLLAISSPAPSKIRMEYAVISSSKLEKCGLHIQATSRASPSTPIRVNRQADEWCGTSHSNSYTDLRTYQAGHKLLSGLQLETGQAETLSVATESATFQHSQAAKQGTCMFSDLFLVQVFLQCSAGSLASQLST